MPSTERRNLPLDWAASNGKLSQYNRFHEEQHLPRKPELKEKQRFVSTNFPYIKDKDEFTCPAGFSMTYRETRPYLTQNNYRLERRFYECDHCGSCPIKA